MNSTKILTGQTGFAAAAFGRSVVANQIAFDVNRALNQRDSQDETPVADAALEAALAEQLDNGLPIRKKLNVEDLIDGHAAAYILLRRAIGSKDPETGRSPDWLLNRLVPLPDAVVRNVDRLVKFNLDRAKADAEAFTKADGTAVDNSAREAAIKAEGDEMAKRMRAEVANPWMQAVAKYAKADDETLVDVALEAMVDAGRDPAAELRRAADAMQDAAAKRYASGKFARLEPSIWAMTTAATKK